MRIHTTIITYGIYFVNNIKIKYVPLVYYKKFLKIP